MIILPFLSMLYNFTVLEVASLNTFWISGDFNYFSVDVIIMLPVSPFHLLSLT
jgi:hypothetical protein